MSLAQTFTFAKPVAFTAGQRTVIEQRGIRSDVTIVSITHSTAEAAVKAGKGKIAKLRSVPVTKVLAIVSRQYIL